jgi:acyl-coenzyme A synthetase/AMP-(fatty) acid ligase/rubrerythrin
MAQPVAPHDDRMAPRWHCPGCGSRRTGFAFAFGRCPDCGEPLLLDVGGGSGRLDALRQAFEIELGGRAFYHQAALACGDETLRALFRQFAVMEGEHMEMLSRRHGITLPSPLPDLSLDAAGLHAGINPVPGDAETLFRIAQTLEQRAAEWFARQAELAPDDAPLRALYSELAAEERAHARQIADEAERWRQGRPRRFAPVDIGPAATATNAAWRLLAEHPDDDIAVESDGQRIGFAALRQRVAQAAGAWRAFGLRPGDRAAVRLADGIDWVVAWLGILWAGGVAVGVNPRIPAPEWQYILGEAGFDLIVSDQAEDTPAPWRARVIGLEEGRRRVDAADPLPPHLVPPDAPAFWVHSSGTSGQPKAVVHAHRCVQDIGLVARERLGVTRGQRLFCSSRLFFAYPLTNGLLAGLRNGATLVLDPRWPTAAGVADIVADTRPTMLFSVPSLYRDLLHEGRAAGLADAGVQRCVSAGEALPASLRRAWREATGLPMIDGYGASEVLALVLTATDRDEALMPSPGTVIEALDPQAADAGGPTRLKLRCPTQALGYLDRPAAQADSFRDGAFCPADLFVRHGAGWRFAGREDALVKIRGRWVNLIDLEERLASGLPGLREAAAVCVPDADGIESVVLFYAGDNDDTLRAALLARSAGLPPHQRPAALWPVQALPRTPTGKLLRRKLGELHRVAAS